MTNEITVTCEVTGEKMQLSVAYNAQYLRKQLFDLIKSVYPQINRNSYLSPSLVNEFREKYVSELLRKETGQLNALQAEVIESIHHNKILSDPIEPELVELSTFGQRLSDKIAGFGGSWTFILSFFTVLLVWMVVNVTLLSNRAFDPYPFILLNLILSCLAAIQAPIIMMSQNRKEQKDRIRGENDYKINLKAELEIKMLHEKMDHIIVHQHQQLLEIQELQREYLKEILDKVK